MRGTRDITEICLRQHVPIELARVGLHLKVPPSLKWQTSLATGYTFFLNQLSLGSNTGILSSGPTLSVSIFWPSQVGLFGCSWNLEVKMKLFLENYDGLSWTKYGKKINFFLFRFTFFFYYYF